MEEGSSYIGKLEISIFKVHHAILFQCIWDISECHNSIGLLDEKRRKTI